MPFVVGETIGPYRIMDQLGKGGMATVFKAYHPALDRYVAVKAMHPVFMEDPSFLARFQREAQVVARLDHPNIVSIYDYSEHEGRPYLVMRYIDGETLKARLSRGPLDEAKNTMVVMAVADALSYAHSQGVLHRDIKPSNVLLSEAGKIYLADFGLARMAQAGQSTLSSDVMLGTPQYISPEQARGNTDLDGGTDIYSLGVMLYEIVTGQVPFNADTPYSIIHDHIYSPLPMPHTINSEIGPSVEKVLMKALAKEREDRFESVQALGLAFIEALEIDRLGEAPAPMVSHESQPRGNYDVTLPPVMATAPGGTAGSGKTGSVGEAVTALDKEAADPPPWADDSQSDMASEIRSRLQNDELNAKEKVGRDGGRRWRWWYLAPALFVFCVCGFIGLAAIGGMAEAGAGEDPAQAEIEPQPEIESQVDGAPGPGDVGGPGAGPDQFRPGSFENDIPQGSPIEAAQRRVNENPDDPIAYLELALAYFEAGNSGEAQGALEEGAEIAGDAHPYYYLEAAAVLSDLEYWLSAAEMYFKLAQHNPRELSPEVRDQAEMAVYLATAEPGSRLLLNVLGEQEGLERPLLDSLQSRFQLYQGRPETAQSIIERVLEEEPGFGPALLVQAEIQLAMGEQGHGERLLEELVREGAQPAWVTAIAEYMMDELHS